MDEVTYNQEFVVPYVNAVRVVTAQLENLQYELKLSKTVRNPIDSIHHRIKTYSSLMDKCAANQVNPDDADEIKEKIRDIGGIRIICLYNDDLRRIARMVGNMPGVSIDTTKDYLTNPKPNGYQSLHLIVSVQISSMEGNLRVPVEIQIRTLAMQQWAQVEHRSKYKAMNPNPGPELDEDLRKAAELLKQMDELFVKIRKESGDK